MMKLMITFLIATTLIGNSIGLYCPNGCTCFQRTVRCIQARLQTIPKIPSDTLILDLRFNQFREIPSKSFEGLKNVHTIFLTENQITTIEEDAFEGLESLKYLYLGNNRINKIATNAFQNLKHLESLYLDKNDIWKFDAKTFSNLPQLSLLFLFNNKISGIPEGAFGNLTNLQRLRLDSNPIECDCGVYEFLLNHKKSGSRATVSLICESPEKYEGRSFASLRLDDFHCRKPKIMEEPHDMEVNDGDVITMPCRIDGDPKPDIVWMQNTNEISNIDEYNNSPKYQILESGSLRIVGANSNDMAIYECIGRNTIGEVRSRPIRLTMNMTKKINQNDNLKSLEIPKFLVTPSTEETVSTQEPLILHCSADGIPNPQIQWYFNGRQISQSTQLTRIHSNGTLVIPRTALRNAGLYKCEATNSVGNIHTTVQVYVNETPEIILEPKSQTIKSGTTLILECDADGDPQPTLLWKHNGNIIEAETVDETSATSQSQTNINRISLQNENTELEIINVKESDSGQYTCVAENINGVTETTADVIVESLRGPPRLIFEPYNIETLTDTTIELPCKGEGDPVPQVEWQRDGQRIKQNHKYRLSSTGSLYIKNITVADGGRYECSVINSFGRATASGLVTVRNQEILAPGDRYVRIAFAEASREIDLAINSTIEMLFNNRSTVSVPNHGDLLRIFRFPTGEARQLARAAEIYERTLVNIRRHVREGENLTIESKNYEYKELLSTEHLHLVAELSGCMQHRLMPNCTDMCYHSKYRNIDGTCNNLNNPTWGASLTAFRRIKKPVYENKFSMPIGWTKQMMYNGFKKPSARMISTNLITTNEITPDDRITHMVMQWGQFLDHDLDHAIPSVSSESWDGVDCKKTCEYAPPCYPMDVPANDPRVKNRRCIDFVRSSAICGSGMTSVFFDSIQPREQINQLTSYIDASQVYGYSFEFSQELRNLTTDDGRLRTGVNFPNQNEMLPFAAPQDGIDCRRNLDENKMNCFVAGDIRVNEQVGLLAMHTIWMREHNRIATKLRELNPHWDGDTIYEETRKIVGAQMQHFTYSHWLPLILGEEGMKLLGQYQGYNQNLNPSISNEFATAALRFGHSLINPVLHRLNSTYQPIPQGHLQLHKAFFAPWRLVYEGGVDPLMRGLFTVPAKLKTPGQNLNADLTEKLFQTAHAVALDLAAMNVQRGRDHGIPSYNEYRKFCNLTVAKNFDDLHDEITNIEIRNKLKDLYGHPDNIDIWVGGILEDQVNGGKVGPLFRCLLIEQFRRLRDGDRFYYENPSVFLPEQLREIKQSNLGRVLCDNGDNITEVTDNVFILPKKQDGYKNCIDIPGINLYFWQDCGSCNSLAPILSSYVPNTYPKRTKRSIPSIDQKNNLLKSLEQDDNLNNLNKNDDAQFEMNEERVSGLEEMISGFHKELKKLKKKLHKMEQNCNSHSNNNNDDNDNRFNNKHRQCHDANGTKRLNNEIWIQDDCTKCECKNSEITCIREKCGITTCPDNLQPMRNSGDCCPHCPILINPNAKIVVA